MSKADIVNWLKLNFLVQSVNKNEVNFPCPKCQHSSHYFNISKKVGFCHRASCHFKYNLDFLEGMTGSSPSAAGYVPSVHNEETKQPCPVTLPDDCFYPPPVVVDYLCKKRRIPEIEAKSMYSNDNYIFVPVLYEGHMVQYVARAIDLDKPDDLFNVGTRQRYRYAKGAPITNYLYRLYPENHMVLVENTFNALWLDSILGHIRMPNATEISVTTNFGSYLSNAQIDIIKNSNIRYISFLWDEGAEQKAWEARNKLLRIGIRAGIIQIPGQPDDHSNEYILEKIMASDKSLRFLGE